MTDISKWADPAQFWAEPVERNDKGKIMPKLYLLSMNDDPLGDIAAMNKMYAGEVCRDLLDLSDGERRHHWDEVMATQLKAPLEVVNFHFLIEGVDRSFTHQQVRQRTAAYAQESLRFAVKEEVETCEPPSIMALGNSPSDQLARTVWDEAVEQVWGAYRYLVENGIPSEDARGLLPHATATRLHYTTNLRNLAEQAGNRLCTQAQFVWRYVFAGIIDAIRNYQPHERYLLVEEGKWDEDYYAWQFDHIASSKLFRPVCYQINKCPWKASTDRHCDIRERVDAFDRMSIPSDTWHSVDIRRTLTPPIRPEEWLLNPEAARKDKS